MEMCYSSHSQQIQTYWRYKVSYIYVGSYIVIGCIFDSLSKNYVSKIIGVIFSGKNPFTSVLNKFSFKNLKCSIVTKRPYWLWILPCSLLLPMEKCQRWLEQRFSNCFCNRLALSCGWDPFVHSLKKPELTSWRIREAPAKASSMGRCHPKPLSPRLEAQLTKSTRS